jgi:hypothetical protein
METLNNELDKLILNQINSIDSLKENSDKSTVVNDVVKLYKARCEQEKMLSDSDARQKEVELKEDELQLKSEELALKTREVSLKEREAVCAIENTEKDRLIHIIMNGVEFIVPMVFYGIWLHKGMKFEETGTFTSQTFRGLTSKFKPLKWW